MLTRFFLFFSFLISNFAYAAFDVSALTSTIDDVKAAVLAVGAAILVVIAAIWAFKFIRRVL